MLKDMLFHCLVLAVKSLSKFEISLAEDMEDTAEIDLVGPARPRKHLDYLALFTCAAGRLEAPRDYFDSVTNSKLHFASLPGLGIQRDSLPWLLEGVRVCDA